MPRQQSTFNYGIFASQGMSVKLPKHSGSNRANRRLRWFVRLADVRVYVFAGKEDISQLGRIYYELAPRSVDVLWALIDFDLVSKAWRKLRCVVHSHTLALTEIALVGQQRCYR
jgi:hypothetical protein